jgi:hypothetical protein
MTMFIVVVLVIGLTENIRHSVMRKKEKTRIKAITQSCYQRLCLKVQCPSDENGTLSDKKEARVLYNNIFHLDEIT